MSSYLPEKTYVVCTNQTGDLITDLEKKSS